MDEEEKMERQEILKLFEAMLNSFTPPTEESIRDSVNGQIEENDIICKPKHYNWRGIECKRIIKAFLGEDGFKKYCEGCVIKYLYRYTKKGAPARDIAKAAEYLRMLAEEVAREQ